MKDGKRPLDVGIILDQTLALGADDWRAVLDFLKRIVNGLDVSAKPDGARVGILRYTSTPSISLYFNTIRDENLTPYTVNNFIDRITQIQGERRIDLAVPLAATALFTARGGSRPNAKKVGKPLTAVLSMFTLLGFPESDSSRYGMNHDQRRRPTLSCFLHLGLFR